MLSTLTLEINANKPMTIHLSQTEARTLLLAAQGLQTLPDLPATKAGVLVMIRRIDALEIMAAGDHQFTRGVQMFQHLLFDFPVPPTAFLSIGTFKIGGAHRAVCVN